MTEADIEAVAIALRAAADTFEQPVSAYVGGEAKSRWEAAHPALLAEFDGPAGTDWDLEDWKILARAAVEALEEQTQKVSNRKS